MPGAPATLARPLPHATGAGGRTARLGQGAPRSVPRHPRPPRSARSPRSPRPGPPVRVPRRQRPPREGTGRCPGLRGPDGSGRASAPWRLRPRRHRPAERLPDEPGPVRLRRAARRAPRLVGRAGGPRRAHRPRPLEPPSVARARSRGGRPVRRRSRAAAPPRTTATPALTSAPRPFGLRRDRFDADSLPTGRRAGGRGGGAWGKEVRGRRGRGRGVRGGRVRDGGRWRRAATIGIRGREDLGPTAFTSGR